MSREVSFLACQDSIVEVNGIRGNVALMLEKCKVDPTLEPGTREVKRNWN